MSVLFWIVAGLAALGMGIYLGLPRVEGGPAWRRGTQALRTAPKRPFSLRDLQASAGRRKPDEPEASDEAREQTAARKTFLRRRVNPLDLLRLDERGSARRRSRRPFRMSASSSEAPEESAGRAQPPEVSRSDSSPPPAPDR